LHADRASDVGPDDDVLLRLDGRDDVAHRPDAGPLDLAGQDPAPRLRLGAVEQVLVLVRRDVPPLEAEPPAQHHVHRLVTGRAVERGRHAGPPVDDHRVAVVVVHVAAADVEPLALGAARSQVEPPEEQRGVRVVGQSQDPLVQVGRQVGLGHRVAAAGVEGERGVAHRGQVGAGGGEVGALGSQDVVAGCDRVR
jgi:hypothetical protein